jgi:hypothetical protein
MLLSTIKFIHCLKYGIICVDICIIHMQIILTDSIDVIFFQGICFSILFS